MGILERKRAGRRRRRLRVKGQLRGATVPRLTIHKSVRHIYAEVVDDSRGVTLAMATTLDKAFDGKGRRTKECARKIGELVGQRAIEKQVRRVVFDRQSYRYHGVIKEIAEAARKSGLQF